MGRSGCMGLGLSFLDSAFCWIQGQCLGMLPRLQGEPVGPGRSKPDTTNREHDFS